MMHKRCLPRGAMPEGLKQTKAFNTVVGVLQTEQKVWLNEISLPEFDKTKTVNSQEAYIFDNNCKYDIILGRDFLRKAGIILDFKQNIMKWMETILPMRLDRNIEDAMENYYVASFVDEDDQNELDDELEVFVTTPILEAKYEKANILEVTEQQTHLTKQQRKELLWQLQKFDKLFDRTLGHYPHRKLHLELIPGAKPVHC